MIYNYVSFKILYFVASIALSYLSIFYLILPLNMTHRQIRWHVVITCFWAFGVSLSIYMPLWAKVTFAILWELGYAAATIYMFGVGDVCKNFVVLWGCWQIINLVQQIGVLLLEPDFLNVFLGVDLKNSYLKDFLLTYLLIVMTALLIRPMAVFILKKTEPYKVMYRYFLIVVLFLGTWEYVNRILSGEKSWGKADFRVVLVIMLFFIGMVFVLRIKGNMLRQEKHVMERELTLLENKYKKLVDENQDLKTFRHEINRHMEAVRGAHSFVGSDNMQTYIAELESKNSSFFDLSMCGNLYIDSMVEQYYDRLKREQVLLETVLEPVDLNQEQTIEIMNILEDMFRYAISSVNHKQWCRLSLRTRGKMMMCQLEIGYQDTREYYRQKLLNYIGSELYIRQKFASTNQIIKKYNGIEMHWLDNGSIVFAAITPVGRLS